MQVNQLPGMEVLTQKSRLGRLRQPGSEAFDHLPLTFELPQQSDAFTQ